MRVIYVLSDAKAENCSPTTSAECFGVLKIATQALSSVSGAASAAPGNAFAFVAFIEILY
jgi:hypothetical protein